MSFNGKSFIRTCQEPECGHKQRAKHPANYAGNAMGYYPNDKWRDVLCRKCKSNSLDFGTYIFDEDLPNQEVDNQEVNNG